MYSRRTSSNGPLRWIVGLLIIVAAVAAFTIYQSTRTDNSPPTEASIALQPTPEPSQTATATPRPVQFRIVSDKAQLAAPIIELYYASDEDNWDLSHLVASAGHLEGTPQMGQGGNFVLAGHVELKDGARGPFAQIHLLEAGDRITILGDTQPDPTLRQYIVTEVKKVQPLDFGVMRNHGYEELTLITCDDWDQKAQTYQTRVIVHARPAGSILRLTASAAPTKAPTKKK